MASSSSPTVFTHSTTTPKPIRSKLTTTLPIPTSTSSSNTRRRDFLSLSLTAATTFLLSLSPVTPAFAASDDEYAKETEQVITKVRNTLTLDKNDPNIANAVAELRETSNSWVAKYRKDKALLGRASFRDMYSALNAVSGHYVSFGPTAPIPNKRKQRILEEMDTAEKALLRGR